MTILFLLLCLTSLVYNVDGKPKLKGGPGIGPPATPVPSGAVFDITKHGATPGAADDTDDEGESANSLAFIQAWKAACGGIGATRVLIPKGIFVTGPVIFAGPCKAKVTVEIQGNVLANTDISLYSEPHVIMFENVEGVTLTGTGVVDGQGAKHWQSNDCSKNSNCAALPTSIKFHRVNNSVIEGVQSVNPMFFHMFVSNCHNVTIRNVKIAAPFNSPNTDGIHIGSSDLVTIADSLIGTGDDCVSIGHGSRQITVTGVTCGPGHGISVGSLGKYNNELEVVGVLVKNCTLSGTTNGARIKTWPGNKANKASAITYEDLIMDHVKNPIIIDQQYGKKKSSEASHVKISDVHFKNIRGTSATTELVTFACSPALPCEGIEVADVNLSFEGKAVLHKLKKPLGAIGNLATTCMNAKVIFNGKNGGIGCK
ncbi:exopolygalacturonase clone GBGE184-like [Chenopodium quinoa]|uniref:Exopolygalacturonase-like n=1 Tax=Chenopodium quinoa TaxID=63459 RepID=A0A803LA11_CHEQI|nr:exopolygalacturonase clone GBGE184-like [Chenopodium quinoa]